MLLTGCYGPALCGQSGISAPGDRTSPLPPKAQRSTRARVFHLERRNGRIYKVQYANTSKL